MSRSGGRVSPKQPDLGGRLLEIFQRRLRRRRGPGLAVDGEVEVEPVLERASEHGPAVQPREVDVALCETVEGMGETAGPVRRHERQRALRNGAFAPYLVGTSLANRG